MKKKINIKENIINQIMINGNKQTSEKLFLKSLKSIQKIHYKKKFEELIKISLINSSPIVYLKYIKRKRRQTVEFPFLLRSNARISYGIKWILKHCKLKKSTPFYKQLKIEFVNSSTNLSQSVEKKIQIHQQAVSKKKFANYRWF
jgi:ribosomal protein S7